MTDLIPMISAAALMLGIIVAFLIYLAAGVSWALSWYLFRAWELAFDEGRTG